MAIQEWSLVIGVVMSALLALAPWMFMVHAKLAVLNTQLVNLEVKVDRLIRSDEDRAPTCAFHEARLNSVEVQISHIEDRLKDSP